MPIRVAHRRSVRTRSAHRRGEALSARRRGTARPARAPRTTASARAIWTAPRTARASAPPVAATAPAPAPTARSWRPIAGHASHCIPCIWSFLDFVSGAGLEHANLLWEGGPENSKTHRTRIRTKFSTVGATNKFSWRLTQPPRLRSAAAPLSVGLATWHGRSRVKQQLETATRWDLSMAMQTFCKIVCCPYTAVATLHIDAKG